MTSARATTQELEPSSLLQPRIRATGALFLRDAQARHAGSRLGYGWAIIEPLIQIGSLAAVSIALGRERIADIETLPFIATGVIIHLFFARALQRTAGAVDAYRSMLVFPGVQPIDALAARALLEVATTTVVAGLTWSILAITGYQVAVASLLWLLVISSLSWWLGVVSGVIAAATNPLGEWVDKAVKVVVRVAFLAGGLFYSIRDIPSPAQDLLLWNPLLQLVECARMAVFARYAPGPVTLSYPAYFALVISAIAVAAYIKSDLARHGWRSPRQ